MDYKYIIKNGKLVNKEKACVSIFNKALFFDFAVYSNIKVIMSKLFLPEIEIEKLFESAKTLELKHNYKRENILKWTNLLAQKNNIQDALIRILLIGPEQDSDPQLFLFPIGLTFYPKQFYKNGVKLITFPGERYFPTAKTKNLLISYIAYQKATKSDALDALLIDKDGNIREGTRCSFFVIKNNTLITPPKEKVLEGITRKIILEIAPQILKVREDNIALKNIENYDEYFISNTSMNIIPIRQIDNIVLNKNVGEKTKELINLYRNYYKKNV